MPVSHAYQPEHPLLDLGDGFFDPVTPARFTSRILRYRNDRAAARIGLQTLTDHEWRDHFAVFTPLPGGFPQPVAMRYHGYQFRTYNPDLGDGRGFSFAQMREVGSGRLLELGTKGSGQTPWSRRADGRLTLKGGVREILATEMLSALGVNTSSTLSVIETGEQLWRNDEPSPTRSCVLVRLCHGHIRYGTFERHAYAEDVERLRKLVDYAARYFVPVDASDAERPLAFFRAVIKNAASLVAQWMAAGFVHGVLNTDNINITGESFDYGPWRFLPTYDPGFTAAYFDQTGLYAFGRQPETLHWNLCRLAEALLPIADRDALIEAIGAYGQHLNEALRTAYFRRLNLIRQTAEADDALLSAFTRFQVETNAPYEQTFFDFFGGGERWRQSPAASLYQGDAFNTFIRQLEGYSAAAPARLEHPYFRREKPVTMLIDEVEAIWTAIADGDDWSLFHAKLDDIAEARSGYALG